ncbi:MAG: heme-binding protein, partial [Polynucleobacter sp.]|nr:heme-binding protein [Polynucleobacter sp.]
QTVGAVGVSGVTSQQDEQIAEAGIRTAGFSQ